MSRVCPGAEQAQEIYNHIREQTQKHLDSYAREGLRTLCIAKKVTLLKFICYTFPAHTNYCNDGLWHFKYFNNVNE